MSLSSLQLDAFTALAKTASFTKAAALLHVTQSALSQRISKIEAELGATLVIRDRGGTRLTEAGEKLLRYCRLRDATEAEFLSAIGASASKSEGAVVRVAGFSSVTRAVLLPAIAELARVRPARITVMTREFPELPGVLNRSEADLILLGHKIEREDIEAELIGREEYVLVESARARANSDWYLDHDEADDITYRYLRETGSGSKSAGVRRRYLDETYSLIDGVKLGLGRSVLPRHLVEGDAGLRIVNPRKSFLLDVWLHRPRQAYYPAIQSELVVAIRGRAREILS
jgi:DNA-binding transcriptional LysR family regulator